MKSKFDQVCQESYRLLFEEEMPPEPAGNEEENGQSQPPPPLEGEGGNDMAQPEQPPQEQPPQESQLPDPKAQSMVGIETVNSILQLFQRTEQEQKNIINSLKELAGTDGINEKNFKQALQILKGISPTPSIT